MITVDILDDILGSQEKDTEIVIVNAWQPDVRVPVGKIVIEYDLEHDVDKVVLVTEMPKP